MSIYFICKEPDSAALPSPGCSPSLRPRGTPGRLRQACMHSLTRAPSAGERGQEVGEVYVASLKVSVSPVASPSGMAPSISQLRTLPSSAHCGLAIFLLVLQTLRSFRSLSWTLIWTSGDLSTPKQSVPYHIGLRNPRSPPGHSRL